MPETPSYQRHKYVAPPQCALPLPQPFRRAIPEKYAECTVYPAEQFVQATYLQAVFLQYGEIYQEDQDCISDLRELSAETV